MFRSPPSIASRHRAASRAAPYLVAALVLALAGVLRFPSPLGITAAHADPVPRAFQIIVNPANPVTTVDRSFLAQAFLKKVRRWPDGQTIMPVDLTRESAVRRQWSLELLGRSVEAVKNYWQQLIFAGRDLPPPELPSEGEVVTYVLHNPGAIGYVSGTAPLHGAKALGFQ